VLPGEDAVSRRERLAVVPGDTTLEPPRDGPTVTREQAIGDGRNIFRENRDEITVSVVRRQRLVEDPRGVPVLGADGEPRVEDRRRRPHQELQPSAAPPPCPRECGLCEARAAPRTRRATRAQ